MTNEEAIEELSVLYERYSKASENRKHTASTGNYRMIDGQYVEALDLAIKALEQQPCEYKPFTIDELRNEDMQKLLREFQNQKILVAENDCLPSVSIINPSEDCVSRQDALKAIEEEKYDWGNTGVEAIDGCLEAVSNLPSVTLSKTRGKWIINKNDDAGEGYYICSNCKNDVYDITDFCPNCGAKMEVEE